MIRRSADRRSLADLQGTSFDAVIIGSGFGGAMMATQLVDAGWSVLMVERGKWVERGAESWSPTQIGPLTEHYRAESPYWKSNGGGRTKVGAFFCVGGPSVFYGGVALRFRVSDFEPDGSITGTTNAAWPIRYPDLEPWYTQAERLLGVAGDPTGDPIDPPRSSPMSLRPQPLNRASYRLAAAARGLGQNPFLLPLAIQPRPTAAGSGCVSCPTCDGFACAIGAKNDLATHLLPNLIDRGLTLISEAVVTRLVRRGDRIVAVQAVDAGTGERAELRGRHIVLAAGALGSPHLVLASGLDQTSPAAGAIGAYLTRHVNSAVFGLFPNRPNAERRAIKQFGIHDFYHEPGFGKLGAIQQLPTPPVDYIRAEAPGPIGWLAPLIVPRALGLLTIAEDQPDPANRVRLDSGHRDRFGVPELLIDHRYSARDRRADQRLRHHAKRVLRAAGAIATYAHQVGTFSHALGTLRMGSDPTTAPVGPDGRFRGLANLWVADGSALPRSGGVNPSLTIAANALRIGHAVVSGDTILEEVHRAVG